MQTRYLRRVARGQEPFVVQILHTEMRWWACFFLFCLFHFVIQLTRVPETMFTHTHERYSCSWWGVFVTIKTKADIAFYYTMTLGCKPKQQYSDDPSFVMFMADNDVAWSQINLFFLRLVLYTCIKYCKIYNGKVWNVIWDFYCRTFLYLGKRNFVNPLRRIHEKKKFRFERDSKLTKKGAIPLAIVLMFGGSRRHFVYAVSYVCAREKLARRERKRELSR